MDLGINLLKYFDHIDSIIHREENTGRPNITASINWFAFDTQLTHPDCITSVLCFLLCRGYICCEEEARKSRLIINKEVVIWM